MATTKITDLTAYTDPISTDVVPIVDVTSDVTKKVSIADLMENAGSGTEALPGISFDGDPNTGIYRPGADQVAISTGGTGRLFIDSSGNVGINTSPSSLGSNVTTLEIKGGSTTRTGGLRLSSSDSSAKGAFYIYDGAGFLGTETSHPLSFYTGNSTHMTLDTSGRLGLGNSSPGSALDLGADYLGRAISWHSSSTQAFGNIWTSYSLAELVLGRAIKGSTTVADGFESSFTGSASRSALKLGQGTATIYTDAASNVAYGTAITPTPRLHIDSSGNVGIGATSVGAKLHVATAGNNYIVSHNTTGSSSALLLGAESGSTSLYSWTTVSGSTGVPLKFFTGATEAMRLDTSGRLLVNTSTSYGVGSSAAAQLQTGDTAGGVAASFTSWSSFDDGGIIALGKAKGGSVGNYTILSDGDTVGQIRFAAADGTDLETNAALIQCQIDGTPGANDMPGRLKFSTTADGASSPTERMTIKANGNVEFRNGGIVIISTAITSGAGNSALKYNTTTGAVTYDTSSRLVKENIVDCPYGLDAVKLLQPRKYFRTDDQRDEIGFIADELVSILPEFVPIGPKSVITKNEQDTEDVPLGVNYEKLTAVLTKALQEALAKIETLEQRLNNAGIA
jgi:hypothetical protein